MFKFIVLFTAILAVTSAFPGLIGSTHTTTLVQPAVLTKTAYVDHSASSAITHQSYTNLERKVPVVSVVKTIAPVVHTSYAVQQPASVVYTEPLVKTVLSPAVAYSFHH